MSPGTFVKHIRAKKYGIVIKLNEVKLFSQSERLIDVLYIGSTQPSATLESSLEEVKDVGKD